ncbi:MAG: MBL fold metallo-hydrolase [Miniphocaeibacter sp.]|uniref:MBL fold metallo-hydrolase n=1 Tax=Miniphocaeibacter sp. TaxID=3100973 RepID=UPI001816B09C|nr:MBL fold metallo-hydrolase [Gallicola sp.]
MINELKYRNTRTYIIKGKKGSILIDTDWAGTLQNFFKGIKEMGLQVSDIKYLLITHYHPDHMGIAQDLVDLGIELLVIDKQIDYIHFSDEYLSKNKNDNFKPINEDLAKIITCKESREILKTVGIDGEIIYTPGHSDKSISVVIDKEAVIVGDLYPIQTAVAYDDMVIKSWNKILSYNVKLAYYAHAKEDFIGEIKSLNNTK